MNNNKTVFFTIGVLLIILGVFMLIPFFIQFIYNEKSNSFLSSAFITTFIGILLILTNLEENRRLNLQQAFLLTTLSWLSIAIFGCLPFLTSNLNLTVIDAFFESMSGITTTGSTIIVDLDNTSKSILIWRSILQWLGGIGVIVMAITILPLLNVGGMQLFRMESSDSTEKIFSRVDGLDIHEKDFRGRNTVANIVGSVSRIPTRSNFYDFCISNQSIEHWFEYNVSLSLGLSEMARVLKKDKGKMIINFPLFLHGKKEFLQGNIEYIFKEISKYFSIKKIQFVYSGSRKYEGWKLCGQSPYRIKKYILNKGIKGLPESIICEVIAVKIVESKPAEQSKSFSIFRFFNLYKEYTLLDLIIKIINKIKFKKKINAPITKRNQT